MATIESTKDPYLPLAESLSIERLFHRGAPTLGELKQAHFPVIWEEGDPPRDKLNDVPPGGGEGLPGSASAP